MSPGDSFGSTGLQAMLDAIMDQPDMLKGTETTSELEAAARARFRGGVSLAACAMHARELVGARLKDQR
jgi:hypothetical protein